MLEDLDSRESVANEDMRDAQAELHGLQKESQSAIWIGDAPSDNAVFLVDGKTIRDCSRCHPKFRHRPSLIDAEKTHFQTPESG